MKVKTQVKAIITNGDYKSLTINGIHVVIDDDNAYINDTPIPKEIAEDVIDHVKAETPIRLHLHYVEYEANLTLEIEDYGITVTQRGKELLTIIFKGNNALLLTPKHSHKIRNADRLRRLLKREVISLCVR
ncbi:hypothetical protein [Sulfurisphaera tokodaii]|uniref:Uncharacterized protein n=2 Tax=Sulfurisphaera tokodaii TaxID=111955 RepID=Q96XL4_SULTO|nr:hypothetical protein [Sulfurisphaera tokodaii]BAB67613.1 hypothetical protein STK_25020 [Sulfurisphaera tokodaii str. 7]HII75297.1 hypothetical protein [Sulfurisphaera tokodaii]